MDLRYIHEEEVHNLIDPIEVVPLIIKLYSPKSVIDIGCGIGTWLKVFSDYGIDTFQGVDGAYVNKKKILIPLENFLEYDLNNYLNLNKKFDVSICLEVAEHINESSADNLIKTLISHSDTVIFSAAIPGQGGQNHVNEQWVEYWEKKFNEYGYYICDSIRPLIWDNEKVFWWYKQNIFVFKKNVVSSNVLYKSIVHPDLFKQKNVDFLNYQTNLLTGSLGFLFTAKLFFRNVIYYLKVNFDKKK